MISRRGVFARSPNRDGGLNPLTLAAAAGAWLAVLPNWPLWRSLLALPEMATGRGWAFLVVFGLMIAALTTALLALLAWSSTIKPAVTLLLLVAAFGAHFMGAYGIVIDSTMMVNVLQTDLREVRDLLSLRLLLDVFVLAVVPLLFVWTVPVRRLAAWNQLGRNALGLIASLLLLAGLGLASFADLSSTMRNHKTTRYLINPVNSFYALVDTAWGPRRQADGTPRPIGLDAKPTARPPGTKPPLVLLVVGETGRADHFALNGYARPTNPELMALGAVSYTAVTSCGTNTAASLPCMFSSLGREAFTAQRFGSENLLDLAQRAGTAVLWVDNQAGCKGVCDRVPHAYASAPAPDGTVPAAGLCQTGECLDEALLANLDVRLEALPASRREHGVLIVLHQMGSHGPAYFKRSPVDRKPFQPECSTNVLQQCDRTALINAYDNSIAYTDHILARAVGWLQARQASYDTSLLYISDHGESLGENGLYLHGLPYSLAPRSQTHVPWIVWLSPQTQSREGPTMACLRTQRDAPLNHDNLFHSVLGLLAIEASEYRPALDAFAACRKS